MRMPSWILLLLFSACAVQAAPQSNHALAVRPVGNTGFDILVNGAVVAPIRLSTGAAITATRVEHHGNRLRLSGLRCKDPQAAAFSPDDFVSIVIPGEGDPEVRFQLTLKRFNAQRWQALFPREPAPFHFLTCAMPSAQVWHQRGWLNATPSVDPFPLLQDEHVGSPEISSLWNRNWSYLCPLGGHPIPMIGVWDPSIKRYVGYDFQEARAADQSERNIATAYCWQQVNAKSFITLAYPYGGQRYGELVYPHAGAALRSHFRLIVDTTLGPTEDPNERFQERLFDQYQAALPRVPAMNDLSWIPGGAHLQDFAGPIGMGLFGQGGEHTFYPEGTVIPFGWGGHREMPVETALRQENTEALAQARTRMETLLHQYAKRVTVDGEECLFWEKPLSGSWNAKWGGAGVTTMHNSDAWYPARVLVELYRYDRAHGQANPEYLQAIDAIFNWTKHCVWTRNEFADVPSSPFAIGGTLSSAFLLDYYFTFKEDPARSANAALALKMVRNLTWRYLAIWAMDSDRSDSALDSAFLLEPNSGRDWACLACANEVHWNIDSLTQAYVHTGDARMRYYLRGILQRWPALYRDTFADSLVDYGRSAMTEGLGLFDGAGPGRGGRYQYGTAGNLPLNEPVGASKLRVVAGARAAIAFCKDGMHSDITDYRTDGNGACAFRIVSILPGEFDVSFSYPFVDISRMPVQLTRDGQTRLLGDAEARRPEQSPSSLYLSRLRAGDIIQIGDLPASCQPLKLEAPLTEANPAPVNQKLRGFTLLSLTGDTPLPQDWTDTSSFAGIIPGLRWNCGVPYRQLTRGAAKPFALTALGATAVFIAYAPTNEDATGAPQIKLDNGRTLALAGKPVQAWRAWPPIFTRTVLMDYAMLPAGRQVKQIDPAGTLVMAATAFQGTPAALKICTATFPAAASAYAQAERNRQKMLALRRRFASLPDGRMAILPEAVGGPADNFLTQIGLRHKSTLLTVAQFVDPDYFNAHRFPVTFYLGQEGYIKTVRRTGDGKEAIARYLSEGGMLVVLSSGPLPFCYGNGPGDKKGGADSLLPTLGLPIYNAMEKLDSPLRLRRAAGQKILHSVPETVSFQQGDPRLRAIDRGQLNPAHRYTSLISAADAQGKSYGDAACYIEFGAGPVKGGKLLYVWSSLTAGPVGSDILGDVVSWAIEQNVQ